MGQFYRYSRLGLGVVLLLAGCAGSPRVQVINYGTQDVDSVLTHSGRSVATELADLQAQPLDSSRKGLLQSYLEPYSSLLLDAASSWRDLRDDFPANEAAPAWVALLREGRFQVAYGDHTVRVFAPGPDAAAALQAIRPILRLVMEHVLPGINPRIEVFAFANAYETRQLTLGLKPLVVSRDDLTDAAAPLNLAGLQRFLATGAVLEAVEVDEANRLYLYGSRGKSAPLELADLAAAYRAVFWCGDDEPYVSLDRHEDHRFAKVNFGGSLQDTRLGEVVLQADRSFKALSVGLDPNTLKPIVGRIRTRVPEFLPASASALADKPAGLAEYHYWLYPDSVSVVTDGTIGAVESCRFLADVERLGEHEVPASLADFNRRYDLYRGVLPVYADLENVGRLLALMTWLKESGAARRVDLASLLAVELPARTTPRKVPRILAATSYRGPASSCRPSLPGFRERVKIFAFPEATVTAAPDIDAAALLKLGESSFKSLPDSCFAVKRGGRQAQKIAELNQAITLEERRLRDMETEIDRGLRRRSDPAAHEKLVAQYNARVAALDAKTDQCNALVAAQTESNFVLRKVLSIVGGVELSLRAFRSPLSRPDAPRLRTLRELRPLWQPADGVSAYKEWVRSEP